MTVDKPFANCARVAICAADPYIGLVQALLNQRVESRSQYCRNSNFDQSWQAFQFVFLGEEIANDPDLILYLVDADDNAFDAFIAECKPLGKEQIGVFLVYAVTGKLSLSKTDRIFDVLSRRGFMPVFVFGESKPDATNELFLALWSITGPILMPGLIGVDFQDISVPIQKTGCVGYYGHGSASGEERARVAAEQALAQCRNAAGVDFDRAVSCLATVLSDVILSLDEYSTAAEIIWRMIPNREIDMVIPTVIDHWLNEKLDIGLIVFFDRTN